MHDFGDIFELSVHREAIVEMEGLLGKGSAKLRKNLKLFEASADGYRERLEQIKLQKKDNLKKMKAVEQCLERDGSTQCC